MSARKLPGWLGSLLLIAGLLAAMTTGNRPLDAMVFGLGEFVLELGSRAWVVGWTLVGSIAIVHALIGLLLD